MTALDTAKANLVRTTEAREVIDRGPDARKASQLRLHAQKSSCTCASALPAYASDAKRAGGGGHDTHASAMELGVRPQLWARVASRLMPERGDGRPTRRPRHRYVVGARRGAIMSAAAASRQRERGNALGPLRVE